MTSNSHPATTRGEIESFLDYVPDGTKIPLAKDPLISLTPDEIMDQIERKTTIGKEFFLQIGRIIINKKKSNEWRPSKNNMLT